MIGSLRRGHRARAPRPASPGARGLKEGAMRRIRQAPTPNFPKQARSLFFGKPGPLGPGDADARNLGIDEIGLAFERCLPRACERGAQLRRRFGELSVDAEAF